MKFKVWDSKRKSWVSSLGFFLIRDDGELFFYGDRLIPAREFYKPVFSTSKTDKNGVELFDGDYIKYGSDCFVIEWDDYFKRWHKKSFTVKSNGISQVFPMCDIEVYEKTGNKFEDHELWEPQK